jgi:hypothetical protein
MKNAYHLLFFANMLADLFIRLTHLMTALNALNNIDIILTPHRQRILAWHAGHFAPAIKRLRTAISFTFIQIHPSRLTACSLFASRAENLLQLASGFPHAGYLQGITMHRH